jgi:hypothetical protein
MLMNSCWALLKENRKADGKCPKVIGPPPGNSSRILESHWEMPK